MGSDPAISVEQLQNLVSQGQVRYFLLQGRAFSNQQSDVANWIKNNCVILPASKWLGSQKNSNPGQGWMGFWNASTTLYEYIRK